jgi:hypothetical protein
MLDTMLLWALAISLAMLWAAAAWHKFRDRAGFHAALEAYEVLPTGLVRPLARALPWLEATLATSLLVPAGQGMAAISSAIALLLYGAAMAINLARGTGGIDCGCGGGRAQVISWALVIRNLLLACVSLALLTMKDPTTVTLSQLTGAAGIAAVVCIAYVGIGSVLRERRASDMESDQ